MAGVSAALRAAVEDPPLTRARWPALAAGIGGVIRARPEDFVVDELPAYPADGRSGHLLVWMRKRKLSTEAAVREVAAKLGVARAEIGVAGRKDRDAVTRQQISLPARAGAKLDGFRHVAIELSDPRPHSHKLRRGHLQGNRFRLVIRELVLDPALAVERAQALLEALAAGGLHNYYGVQRFGAGARNLEPGLAALRGKRRGSKGDLTLSAGQSALFNLYLARRIERGLGERVVVGDVLAKRETGGLFECRDAPTDQARLEAGELVITGPMFGSKTRSPSADTPAAALEAEILAEAGVTPAQLRRLGRRAPGTRRWMRIWPTQVEAREAAPGPGLALHFDLPSGSYATVLVRELT